MNKVFKYIKDKKHIFLPLFGALLLAVLSYFWIPEKGYDLKEYYFWMDKMQTFNFSNLIHYIFYRGEFLIMTYFFIISMIGNYQILPVLPTFLFYFISLYIICDYAKDKKISFGKTSLIILLFLSLFKYISIVSNLRYALAYIIFALGLYLELVKGKNGLKYKALYLIPIFIHTSSFILLFFRLILNIKNKKIVYIFLAISCIVLFFPNLIIKCLSIFNSIEFVDFMIDRVNLYLINEQVPMYLQYLFRICQTALFGGVGFICYKKIKDNNMEKFNYFFVIISIFTISVMMYHTFLMRFSDFMLFLFPIILFQFFEVIEKSSFLKIITYVGMIALIIAGIRIQVPIFEIMYF